MPKLKSLGSPGSNIKSFFRDQSELLSDLPSGSTSRKKSASSRPPRAKADATKRIRERGATDQKVRVILDWCNSLSEAVPKSKKLLPILSKEADAKVSSITVDKDCHPKDASELLMMKKWPTLQPEKASGFWGDWSWLEGRGARVAWRPKTKKFWTFSTSKFAYFANDARKRASTELGCSPLQGFRRHWSYQGLKSRRKSLSECQREWTEEAAASCSADCFVSKRNQKTGEIKWWRISINLRRTLYTGFGHPCIDRTNTCRLSGHLCTTNFASCNA